MTAVPKIDLHPGYIGAFTRAQAEGAIPNGTTVMKCSSEHEDGNPNGTLGVVLGSLDGMLFAPELVVKYNARILYFVEWETTPRTAVVVVDRKIARPS